MSISPKTKNFENTFSPAATIKITLHPIYSPFYICIKDFHFSHLALTSTPKSIYFVPHSVYSHTTISISISISLTSASESGDDSIESTSDRCGDANRWCDGDNKGSPMQQLLISTECGCWQWLWFESDKSGSLLLFIEFTWWLWDDGDECGECSGWWDNIGSPFTGCSSSIKSSISLRLRATCVLRK